MKLKYKKFSILLAIILTGCNSGTTQSNLPAGSSSASPAIDSGYNVVSNGTLLYAKTHLKAAYDKSDDIVYLGLGDLSNKVRVFKCTYAAHNCSDIYSNTNNLIKSIDLKLTANHFLFLTYIDKR